MVGGDQRAYRHVKIDPSCVSRVQIVWSANAIILSMFSCRLIMRFAILPMFVESPILKIPSQPCPSLTIDEAPATHVSVPALA